VMQTYWDRLADSCTTPLSHEVLRCGFELDRPAFLEARSSAGMDFYRLQNGQLQQSTLTGYDCLLALVGCTTQNGKNNHAAPPEGMVPWLLDGIFNDHDITAANLALAACALMRPMGLPQMGMPVSRYPGALPSAVEIPMDTPSELQELLRRVLDRLVATAQPECDDAQNSLSDPEHQQMDLVLGAMAHYVRSSNADGGDAQEGLPAVPAGWAQWAHAAVSWLLDAWCCGYMRLSDYGSKPHQDYWLLWLRVVDAVRALGIKDEQLACRVLDAAAATSRLYIHSQQSGDSLDRQLAGRNAASCFAHLLLLAEALRTDPGTHILAHASTPATDLDKIFALFGERGWSAATSALCALFTAYSTSAYSMRFAELPDLQFLYSIASQEAFELHIPSQDAFQLHCRISTERMLADSRLLLALPHLPDTSSGQVLHPGEISLAAAALELRLGAYGDQEEQAMLQRLRACRADMDALCVPPAPTDAMLRALPTVPDVQQRMLTTWGVLRPNMTCFEPGAGLAQHEADALLSRLHEGGALAAGQVAPLLLGCARHGLSASDARLPSLWGVLARQPGLWQHDPALPALLEALMHLGAPAALLASVVGHVVHTTPPTSLPMTPACWVLAAMAAVVVAQGEGGGGGSERGSGSSGAPRQLPEGWAAWAEAAAQHLAGYVTEGARWAEQAQTAMADLNIVIGGLKDDVNALKCEVRRERYGDCYNGDDESDEEAGDEGGTVRQVEDTAEGTWATAPRPASQWVWAESLSPNN